MCVFVGSSSNVRGAGGAARHVDPATVKPVKDLTPTAIRPLDTAIARYCTWILLYFVKGDIS